MSQIILLTELANLIPKLKSSGKKIILVTGVFDLLHSAHKKFLQKAKRAGDILIIGVETDQRVKLLKGDNRPINPLLKRLENLTKLSFPDYIFSLPEKFNSPKDHQNLIKTLQPDILAVSSHSSNLKSKEAIIKKFGGKLLIVMQKDPSISTSKLVAQKTSN